MPQRLSVTSEVIYHDVHHTVRNPLGDDTGFTYVERTDRRKTANEGIRLKPDTTIRPVQWLRLKQNSTSECDASQEE